LVPGKAEKPQQKVFEHVGAEVSDMREVVDGGAAGVNADDPGNERLKFLFPAAEGVVKSDHEHPIIAAPSAKKKEGD
jgi:hypothetical protein